MSENWISDRMHQIDASGIRKVFDLAATMERPVNLSIGQPHFDTPPAVKAALTKAVEEGHNAYSQTQGIRPLIDVVYGDLVSLAGLPSHPIAAHHAQAATTHDIRTLVTFRVFQFASAAVGRYHQGRVVRLFSAHYAVAVCSPLLECWLMFQGCTCAWPQQKTG